MPIYSANYKETHYEYPDLPKIVGCPTYDTLPVLKNEIKANALSVHSNLGLFQLDHVEDDLQILSQLTLQNIAGRMGYGHILTILATIKHQDTETMQLWPRNRMEAHMVVPEKSGRC